MCAFQVNLTVKNIFRQGDKNKLLTGIEEIESNLVRICEIVGELTLAVDKNKKSLYMLDFGPAQDGSTAIANLDAIRRGMQNIKNFVSSMPG